MVDVKIVVVSIVAVLSAFLQRGIKPQPTIGSSSEDYSCSQLEEELDFHVGENMQLRREQESERRIMETLENASSAQMKENRILNLELESKQQLIESQRNVSSAQLEEIHRLNLELGNKQDMIETLGNASTAQMEENHRLKLENERLRLMMPPVTATFIGSFDHSQSHYGITKAEDKIFVLDHHPNAIKVYEDRIGFPFMANIALTGTNWPYDIVYSKDSTCVYISNSGGTCIWVVTTIGERRLTKWLTNVHSPHSLSLSNEGHLLVLRIGESFNQIEFYSLSATLIRTLRLPEDVKYSQHVAQTLSENNIILHRLNNASSGPWAISQLTNDGQLINRFIPRNQSEKLSGPSHLTLISAKNLFLVADTDNKRVIVFDSVDLTWKQVLLSQEKNGIAKPFRLLYDASKKRLFVAQYYSNVSVYEIN